MKEIGSLDLHKSFADYKEQQGITHDTGGALEGLHQQEQMDAVREFEQAHPGIGAEFERLIQLLPDADTPNKDEFPFAASVVRFVDGKLEVLARSTNLVNTRGDSTQHAEVVVLQEAQKKIGSKHLDGCLLLSTVKPCLMCSGAVEHTQINTLVYAVSQQELRGTHVKFATGFKPVRTVPPYVDTDMVLRDAGVTVVAGYMHNEVLRKMQRVVGTFSEYYQDPDAK